MKWGREVLLNQRDVNGDEWGLLYENTVTLLGGENTLYEVGADCWTRERWMGMNRGHSGRAG